MPRSKRLAPSRDPRTSSVLESSTQRGCLEVFRLYGYETFRIGQYNAARTQDAGVADVYALHDLDGAVWCECKRPVGGRWPLPQQRFAERVVAAGGVYVLANDPAVLAEVLSALRRERIARDAKAGVDERGVEALARTSSAR